MTAIKILVTGSTGLLGQYVIPQLHAVADEIYLLVRHKSVEKAQHLFRDYKKVEIIVGDITTSNVVDSQRDMNFLIQNVNQVLHMAAYYDLQGTSAKSYLQNIVGTQNLLFMLREFTHLQMFHYISTIAVAGALVGQLQEREFDMEQSFNNEYAKTKFYAESMVHKWQQRGVYKKIYRPGIIVGDSRSGEMGKVDGPYYFFRALAPLLPWKKILNHVKYFPFPFDNSAILPMIPVDQMAQVLVHLLQNATVEDRCYHVFDPHSPQMGVFMQDVLQFFGLDLQCVPLPQQHSYPKLWYKFFGLPEEIFQYTYGQCSYEQKNFLADTSTCALTPYEEYKENIFRYAREMFAAP